jgi:catechol 2,3-dioxygenase-like lactoylglutathione lyase family enzyme
MLRLARRRAASAGPDRERAIYCQAHHFTWQSVEIREAVVNSSLKGLFKYVDHVAWTVLDIEAVAKFYQEVFGAEELYRLGPFDARELPRSANGKDWTEAHLNVADGRLRLIMLRLADNLNFELFEYSRPAAAQAPPRNSDIGGHHIAFRVESIEATAAYLEKHGCTLLEIIETAGQRVQYVLDPWGNQLELME